MSTQLFQQSDLLQKGKNHFVYIELCNAFYAREILKLSREQDDKRIRRMLASLSYYIQRAAEHVIHGNSPLQLDSQNGSWIAKQRVAPPKQDRNINRPYFEKNSYPGSIVPLAIIDKGELIIKIDSLDRVMPDKMHCNEHGWFDLSGEPLEQQDIAVLKPTKVNMTAACCGHRWNQGKRSHPRLLTLREMLLATQINWHNFAKPFKPQR